jgi:hypothetical protein
MSVEELKKALTTLSLEDQNEVSAFLFHLRHRRDAGYQAAVDARLSDKQSSHWLSPEEFEKQLDKK